MIKLNPYLNFPGTTEEAFKFYKSVFGGDFLSVVRFKDMPIPGAPVSKEQENKIMHIALPIGDQALMGTDVIGEWANKFVVGTNTYITIVPDSKPEADRIFKALSAGGKVEMPMSDQPWGAYYGSFKDKYGYPVDDQLPTGSGKNGLDGAAAPQNYEIHLLSL
jgi:PhnB protein